MDFTNINSTQFEELCFELLQSIGCRNVNWRKGTGYDNSPSDSGRDIECEYYRYDTLLGEMIVEKWFIECKHYKSGVSPNVLTGATQWAIAEQPDRLIIMTTSFLTNPCKEFLKKLNQQNKFKISYWEKPKIEKMLLGYKNLLRKYDIEYKDNLINIINDIHIEYIKRISWNSIDDLKHFFNNLSKETQEEICGIVSLILIRDRSMEEFKNKFNTHEIVDLVFEKIEEIAKISSEQFSVFSFVQCVLSNFINFGNENHMEKMLRENDKFSVFIRENGKDIIQRVEKETGETINNHQEFIEDMINKMNKSPEQIQLESQKRFELYKEFCEKVVINLINKSCI